MKTFKNLLFAFSFLSVLASCGGSGDGGSSSDNSNVADPSVSTGTNNRGNTGNLVNNCRRFQPSATATISESMQLGYAAYKAGCKESEIYGE